MILFFFRSFYCQAVVRISEFGLECVVGHNAIFQTFLNSNATGNY